MVVVDPDKIARAIQEAVAPAWAKIDTNPNAASPARAKVIATPNKRTPARATPDSQSTVGTPARDAALTTIRHLGRTLDDLERLRIMNGNRVAAAHRDGVDLPWMDVIDAHLRSTEHAAELELKRAWRKHPLAAWAKPIPGAGELLMARLIAEIDGDRLDKQTGEVRTGPLHAPNPAKLLAYCGHGDPARAGKVPKGATQEELFKRGSPSAKKAVWKLSYQFMRTVGTPATATHSTDSIRVTPSRAASPRSPYRDIYDERKSATVGKLHDEKPCVRCGPSGKPAAAGSEWSDAHRHADALRIVGKEFLKNLWEANRARA